MKSIADNVIHPLLSKYHLPLYHDNPEYHASFAWCLLHTSPPDQASSFGEDGIDLEIQSTPSPMATKPFSQDLIDDLNRRFEKRLLAAQPESGWVVPHLTLRVGKSLTEIPLS